MKKFKELLKKSHWLALFCGVVALLCSMLGALVNTSFFSVSVNKVTINMDEFYETHPECDSLLMSRKLGKDGTFAVNAELTGNIYTPKGVDAKNPAPCVILTHGYLNSKEFEEAPAIEMSRRGYVVFEFDQYDHGESTWDTSVTGSFSFFMWSVYDAVQYMYAQDYVLKAPDGTGMMSVSGHSMGGFSSEMATAMDGMNAMFTGIQKICACLAVGADFMYTGDLTALFGNRSFGAIAGIYDEFFFDQASEATGETVREKHYTKDPQGAAILGTPNGESGVWYTVAGGQRIIYEVQGDHPYNTWSPEATKCMIEFYTEAFKYQAALHGADLSKTTVHEVKGQSWWLKEVFTTIGLIALVGMMLALALTLVKLPFFKDVVTPETEITPVQPTGLVRKIIGIVITLVSIGLGCAYIPAFMDMNAKLNDIHVFGLVVMIVGLVVAVLSELYKLFATKLKINCKFLDEFTEHGVHGGLVLACVAFALRWFTGDVTKLFSTASKWFTADSVTVIVYWAVGAGLLALIFTLISHFFVKKGSDASNLGLKASFKQVTVALTTAIVVTGVGYLVLLLCDSAFGVDFRSYIYAFRPITKQAFNAALRYMPLFLIFYICCGVNIANATEGMKGIKADLYAVGIELLPVALFLILEYSTQQIGGVGLWPSFALNVIVVQNLVWTLIFLAVIQRRTLKATGNIWTGVFINTIWFTMITLATTCIYLF